MKWSDKYPNSIVGRNPEGNILRMARLGRCIICNSETTWANCDKQQYVCSEECDKKI